MKNNTNLLVSIIVPVYNAEKYISKCIESLVEQTYRNIEILLINDGSTDESEVIILEYCEKDSRIIYRKKENEGVSKARNYGISMAEGNYLTFVDADDWVSIDFIERAVKMMDNYKLDLVLGGTMKVYSASTERCVANTDEQIIIYDKNNPVLTQKVLSNGITSDRRLNSCFTSGPVCKIFRKEIIGEIRFDEKLIIGEDTVFNLRVIERSNKVGVVPEVWYYYRMNDFSVTKKYNPNIQKHTEVLMETLTDRYFEDSCLNSFLCVRAIQQFYGMLMLGTLNKQSKNTLIAKIKNIKRTLNQPVWKKNFDKNAKDLPASKLDKILVWLCKNKLAFMIVCFVKLRIFVKELKQEKIKWKN